MKKWQYHGLLKNAYLVLGFLSPEPVAWAFLLFAAAQLILQYTTGE